MAAGQKSLTLAIPKHGAVSAVHHRPAGDAGAAAPALLLAHGAGNDMTSPILLAVAESLAFSGIHVLRFNYPYTEAGRRAPDRANVLLDATRAAADLLRDLAGADAPLFLGGKSMGGRIASHLAAEGYPCAGLVFLGYPLHPAGKTERAAERAAHLPRIKAPMLFIQGSRDALCDLALLRPALAPLGARATLHVIEEGDHSFKVPRRTGRTTEEVWDEVAATARSFIQGGARK
jgi:predicted alpha/beta-hydrolase family hydrolase